MLQSSARKCTFDLRGRLWPSVTTRCPDVNVERCFKLSQYSPPKRDTSGKLFVSSESIPEDVSHNPNRPRDHLLSARERLTAKTLLIAAFIFDACPCAIRRHIAIPRSLRTAKILFARCIRHTRETRALRITALETTRSM